MTTVVCCYFDVTQVDAQAVMAALEIHVFLCSCVRYRE